MSSNETVKQIQEALDIADIIGENVKLRHTSRGYMGLCPFHQEDTPSFYVYTDTQSYYCFGCHESGNIFTYIMKTEGLSFPETLRVLADRAGIKLDTYHREDSDTYSVLALAEKFFTDNLAGNSGGAARAYMSRRNFTPDDLQKFSIGYSPNAWDSLTLYLRSKGIPDKAILDAGLALEGKYGLYDRFRGRVIFPIHDITGKVIAFGGRIIDGDGAKYINSPEGKTYRKRQNLYMLDTARKVIREKGRSILVEGYMDALRLHKAGYTETVASLGTSLTPEQAALLSRYADMCYICYDSDSAGQAAAIKGMYTLAEHGLQVYVVSLPQGKDPDEFLSNNPPEDFEALLSSAKPLVLMHVDSLRPALLNEKTRRAAITSLFDGLSKLNIDDVLQHMGSICEATVLTEDIVKSYIVKNNQNNQQKPATKIIRRNNNVPAAVVMKHDDELEAGMCAVLWRSPECRASLNINEAMSILRTNTAREIIAAILNENTEGLEELWLTAGDMEKTGFLKIGENFCTRMDCETDAERFVRIYSALKRGSIDRRIAELKTMPPNKQNSDELFALLRQRGIYSR